MQTTDTPSTEHHPYAAGQGMGYCQRHGRPYLATVVIENQAQYRRCPECELEAGRRQDAEAAQRRLEAARAQATQLEVEQRIGRAGIPLRYRNFLLSTFPVERCEPEDIARAVLEGCRSYLNRWDQIKKAGTCLVLVGAPGRGKTGLACSIGNGVIANGGTAFFIRAYDAVCMQRSTWGRKGRSEMEVREDLTKPDLLILDDVGAQIGSESEMQMLFSVIDDRYANRRPTVIVSNLPVEDQGEIKGLRTFLGHRIMDRILDDDAMVLGCNWKTLRGNRT